MSIKRSIAVITMLCLVFTTLLSTLTAGKAQAEAAGSSNLVLNPSFEDGEAHWSFEPEQSAGIATNNPRTGSTNAWINPGTTHTISQKVTIPETGVYKLSAYASNWAAGGSMTIKDKSFPFSAYSNTYTLVELPDLAFKKGEEVEIVFKSGPDGWLNVEDVELVSTSLNQLSEVLLDNLAAADYDLFKTSNLIVLPKGTSVAPQLSAILADWAKDKGAEMTYEQAATLPGEAKIHVTFDGMTTTHTVAFIAKSDNPLASIALSASEDVLPLDGETQLIVTGTLEDGNTIDLLTDALSTVKFEAPSKLFVIGENGKARAGTYDIGDIEVNVTVSREGETFIDKMKFTIKPEPARPYIRDYTQTLTMKLFLGKNGQVDLNLEEALDAIKKMDNMTRNIPKIVYLVGWQHDGHDSKYPDWNLVNPKLKREQDATALDSLKWLMDEAVKYNTTVSLHINMTDAYENSPQWDEFIEKDLIRKDEHGELIKGGLWVSGQSYRINLTRAWESGVLKRNIDDLLEMLPQLKRGGTIHIDAFVTNYIPSEPNPDDYSSPYHQTTFRQDTETQKKIIRYWRDQGIDFTSEYFQLYREDPLYGIQPMAWWADWRSLESQMELPAQVAVGGRGGHDLLGVSMHGEDIVMKDKTHLTGFLQEFSQTTLPWQYLNQFDRLSYDSATNTIAFSGGVTSSKVNDKSIIKQGEVLLVDGTDVFVPALWKKETREIIAFSESGYTERSWKLPLEWSDVERVHIFEIGMGLPRLIQQDAAIVDGEIRLSLLPGQAFYLTPADAPVVLDPLQELAASITSVPTIERDVQKLKWPTVPEGYKVEMAKSDQLNVIDLNGRIAPPMADTTVMIVLQVKRLSDGAIAYTAPIAVTVPEGSVKNIEQVYSPKDAVLSGQARLKEDTFYMTGYALGYVGGEQGNDNIAAFTNIMLPGDSLYELTLEYATAQPRTVFVRANDGEGIAVSLTGSSWQDVQRKKIRVPMKEGMNRVELYNPDGYAPDMGAIVVQSISPYTIADEVDAIQAPAKQDKVLTLPDMPFGFTIAVKYSDHEDIIQPDGAIIAPKEDTMVKVVLEVTRQYDNSKAETVEFEVLVPGIAQIEKIAAVNVETTKGTAPVLPSSVVVTYSDGSTANAAVVWEAIQPSDYEAEGAFTVSGTVEGTAIKAIANVTVKPKSGGGWTGPIVTPVDPEPKPEPEPEAKEGIIELLFKPTAEQLEVPGSVSVVKVGKDGTRTAVVFSHYDAKTGIVKVKGSAEYEYEVVYSEKKFKDILKYEWAEEAIEALAARGVLHGIGSEQFAPQKGLKRADLVMMLVRMFQLTAEADSNFADVSESAYYYNEVAIAKRLGIIQGVSSVEFRPEAEVTREELFVILDRVLRLTKLNDEAAKQALLDSFKDSGQVAGYAKTSIATLVHLNLVTGNNNQLLPKKTASRAETAVMLYRIIAMALTE
ncbi:S-layer homology domain-containing protein [Paenibacillus sp. GXUN7292]|uniref:S-layer homology domain-containing protein n=1 Tax=Paenibacillus sp. GXUN7292 TaxID=3422499 RepID=UPI003D7CB018